jgi:hypothetical protein
MIFLSVMKKSCPLLLLLFITINYAFGQSDKFGAIPIEELEMKSYSKDSSADAVILFAKKKVTFDHIMGMTITVHTRIKIFKRSAFDLGDVAILEEANIDNIKASTFYFNNGVIERHDVSPDLIFKTNHSRDSELNSFAFTNLKEGSVIEYEYTVKTNNENLYLPFSTFQYTIPAIYCEYELYITKLDEAFSTNISGELKPVYETAVTRDGGKYHKWTMHDVPAFKDEPYMPDKRNYIPVIRFSFNETWEDVYRRLMLANDFGRTFYDKYYHSHFSFEMTAIGHINDDEIKIKEIVDLVKRNITWNKKNDFASSAPENIIKRKTGSSGDINLLLGNLLNKAGYHVSLLLLSTKDHGLVLKDYPSFRQFNYVICQVKLSNKTLFLDATEKLLPYNMIPDKCYNTLAFYFAHNEIGWIKMDPTKEKVFVNGNFILSDKGELNGIINYSNFELSAFHARKLHKELSEEDFNKKLFNETSWSVKKIKTQDLDSIEKPLIEDVEISIPEHGTVANDVIYFSPFVFFKSTKNPFTQDMRNYPIDLGLPQEKTMIITITIPDNYVIDELPKTQVIALPNNDARYTLNISATGNKIQITTKFQLNKTMYLTNEYPGLKEFYKRLVSKNSESIVLKRIK